MLRSANATDRRAAFGFALLWWGYIPIALIAALGLLMTGLTVREVDNAERQRVQNAFQEAARDRVLVIEREFKHTLALVQDLGNFIGASPWIGRREFRKFVYPALKRHGSIQAFEWVPRVTAAERTMFVREARSSFPKFRITERDDLGQLVEAAPREELFPILYVQPYQRNKEALGFDLASDPLERAALLATADAGEVQVSDPVQTDKEGMKRIGFVARQPVFVSDFGSDQENPSVEGEVADAPAVRSSEPRGFAIGIFHVGDVVERALTNLSPGGVDLRIYDLAADGGKQLLYHHVSRVANRQPDSTSVNDASKPDGWEFAQTMNVANRQWAVVSTAIPGRFRADPRSGWIIFTGGAAFTLLLTVYLATLVGQAAKVRRLVDERTEQLVETNTALVNEVTERKRTERALQELNITLEQRVALRTAEAERRARDLEQFAYVVSHDLKAPLRAIGNLAGWLQEDLTGKLNEETGEQLMLLKDRVRRMQILIDGLLQYSRVGAMASSYETVDTAQLLAETVDSLSPPEGFVINTASDMPTLRADRLLLGQVFANLIGNSIKHHGSEHGHVWVTVRDVEDYYEFSVADDGRGIAPEYHQKVFMMFKTLETKDYGTDTGIGLALVKKIVQEQGGLITLHSAEGEGTTLRFTWPKQPEP